MRLRAASIPLSPPPIMTCFPTGMSAYDAPGRTVLGNTRGYLRCTRRGGCWIRVANAQARARHEYASWLMLMLMLTMWTSCQSCRHPWSSITYFRSSDTTRKRKHEILLSQGLREQWIQSLGQQQSNEKEIFSVRSRHSQSSRAGQRLGGTYWNSPPAHTKNLHPNNPLDVSTMIVGIVSRSTSLSSSSGLLSGTCSPALLACSCPCTWLQLGP